MKGLKYVNLIEIYPVVIEIWSVENGDLSVQENNTCVLHIVLGHWHMTMCLNIYTYAYIRI